MRDLLGSQHERTENPWGLYFCFFKKGDVPEISFTFFLHKDLRKGKKKGWQRRRPWTSMSHCDLTTKVVGSPPTSCCCNFGWWSYIRVHPTSLSQDKSGKTQILGLQGAGGFPKQRGFLYSWLINGSTHRCMASFRWFALKQGSWYKTITPETIGDHSKSGMIQQKDLLLCTCFKSAHLSLGNEQNHN